MKNQWYIGICNGSIPCEPKGKYKAFRPILAPTEENYNSQFFALIGPFQTKRAALWAEKYGRGNPHFQHVADAERLSKI